MALLSLPAFVICLTLIGIGMWMHSRRLQDVGLWIQRTLQQEVHSFNTLRDLLDGFKRVGQARAGWRRATGVESAA